MASAPDCTDVACTCVVQIPPPSSFAAKLTPVTVTLRSSEKSNSTEPSCAVSCVT